MPRGFGPIALAAALALGVASAAAADNFPEKPIKLIVPFGAGGPPDVAARIIGAYLSDHLGPVVVENHVGAGGTLAARAVAGSPPDGYTLLAATAGSLAISPQLYKDAGIDPVKDFAAVAMVSSAPLVVAINPSIAAKSVKELVAYAKANPGKLNYGAVTGTPPHMSGEMFKHITGANIVFVPYKHALAGIGSALLSHKVDFDTVSGDTPSKERDRIFSVFQNTGKLKVLLSVVDAPPFYRTPTSGLTPGNPDTFRAFMQTFPGRPIGRSDACKPQTAQCRKNVFDDPYCSRATSINSRE